MSLIGLLVVVLVLGLVFYVLQQIPMSQPFRTVALIIVAIIAILWLLGGADLRVR